MEQLLEALQRECEKERAKYSQKEQKYDQATIEWFEAHPGEEVWMTLCPKCERWYITKLGHTCEENKE